MEILMKWILMFVLVCSAQAEQSDFDAMMDVCLKSENPALCLSVMNDALENNPNPIYQQPQLNSQQRNITRPNGTTVYRADECIGAIVNSVCRGSILPKQSVHKKCYGQMLNGRCTGPMF